MRSAPGALTRSLAAAVALTFAACSSEPPADSDDSSEDEEAASDEQAASDEESASDDPGGRRDASARDAAARPRDAGSAARDSGSMQAPRDAGARPDAGASRPDAAAPSNPADGGGDSVSGIPPEELEMLRQVCIDEINMYRATLQLPPFERASPAHELCSDQGAKKDGDTRSAHSSAGMGNPCVDRTARPPFPGFGSQNTCPGWPVGRLGSASIADALKRCLAQMWAEGDPPQGEMQCIQEYFAGDTACFLAHGHYINMKGSSRAVSCGFYNMGSDTYWMNQDFL